MSLHADARDVLHRWSPPDPEQARLRERYVHHLEAHPDGVWRVCRPDHVTASALIVSHDYTRVLLTLHHRVRRWLQTGGHCEPGDDLLADAALREAREESGIHDLVIDPSPVLLSEHQAPCLAPAPGSHLDVQFVATATTESEPVCSAESVDVRWFGFEDLPGDTDDSVRALVVAARGRLAC